MSKKVVVTGGAGFIGSHLVNLLHKKKYDLTVYDNFSNGSGKKNLPSKIKIVKGDILNYSKLRDVFKKVDTVYHLAVLPLIMSFDNPDLVVRVNDYGTYLVSKICADFKIKLIHVSSSEAYGTARYNKMNESHPLLPTTVYAASKASSESYVRAFENTYGLKSVIVRPFNSYGKFMREDSYGAAIPNFVNRIFQNKNPIIFGTGNQTRDLTNVSDTVMGIYLASKNKDAIGQTFNIAQGKEISINEVAKITMNEYSKITGKEIQSNINYKKERLGDVRKHLGDITLAKKVLGYKPKISIKQGIREYIIWKMSNN